MFLTTFPHCVTEKPENPYYFVLQKNCQIYGIFMYSAKVLFSRKKPCSTDTFPPSLMPLNEYDLLRMWYVGSLQIIIPQIHVCK